MALPVQMFPLLSPQQISPVATGIGQAQQMYAQAMQNQYLQSNLQAALQKQQLANQLSQAAVNIAPQMTAAQLAYSQAQSPNLNAQTQNILSGTLPQAQANAKYIGTEAAKNQFQIQNPATMLPPGIANQIGNLAVLKKFSPNSFAPSPSSQSPNNSPLPGMPSAGNFTQSNQPTGFGTNGIPYANLNNAPITGQSQQSVAGGNNSGLPTFEDATKLAVSQFTAPIEKNLSQANYYNTKSSGYNNLPPTEKSYMIAQAAGMGIDPQQAATDFLNGATIDSLANKQGLDPKNLPSPLYAATPQTVQLIQRRNQAIQEIGTIQPNLTSGLAPYARRFNGFSPTQITNAIENDDPDQQARFLAAKALTPEMASLRLKAAGGNVGIEAIKEINNQSMGNIKSFQGLVTPKVYSAAQNYVDQWINQGADAANKIGLAGTLGNTGGVNPSQLVGNSNTSSAASPASDSTTSSGMVTMKAPNGEIFHIPSNNVASAIKMGAIQQ